MEDRGVACGSKCLVTFGIKGEDLDFDAITQAMGLSPSHCGHKGDPYPDLKDCVCVRDTWMYVPDTAPDRPLEEHIDRLREVIWDKKEYLREIQNRHRVEIQVIFEPLSDFSYIVLPHTLMNLYTDLEIPFEMGIAIKA